MRKTFAVAVVRSPGTGAARLRAERDAQADAGQLQVRVVELEDGLAAARTSLRPMMRTENLPGSSTTTENGVSA